MTDPAGPVGVEASLAAWARARFGPGTTVAEAPSPVLGGLDTYIYRFRLGGVPVGTGAGPLILRLYPSAGRGPSAVREEAVLRFLSAAGYPAPAVVDASPTLEAFGLPFLVMEQVPGVTVLDAVTAKPQRAPALIDTLARAQATLHRINPAGWPLPVPAGGPTIDRRLEAAASEALPEPGLGKALRWLRANRHLAADEQPAVCHNDFHPMNALVDGAGRISVIDWEGAGVGDRHADLARSLVLFEWGPAVASSPVERWVLRVAKPWLVRRYLRAYAGQLPVDPARLRYWMAFHAADGWSESARLLAGTFVGDTRTETREGPAVLVGPAMEALFHRLAPDA